jgi:hypothetical protein
MDPPTASLQLIEQHGIFDDPQLTDEQTFQWVKQAIAANEGDPGLRDPMAQAVTAAVPGQGLPESSGPWGVDPPAAHWPDAQPKSINLVASTTAARIDLDWLGSGTLEVRLARGEWFTVELSSKLLASNADHLAITTYINNQPIEPDQPTRANDTDTLAGRNAAVTPPQQIDVVHAVKTPLAVPLWNLKPVDITRGPADTAAVLNATLIETRTGGGLHSPSTERVDIAASWNEFEDLGPQADPGNREITIAHLDSRSIVYTRNKPPEPGHETRIALRHEFGDTKHRNITYTLTATSRFRQFFDPNEAVKAFQVTRSQPVVNILSTVRPPAPVVLGVVPAFKWVRIEPGHPGADPNVIVHTRRQRLRIELARPWYTTGQGEQLAVILAQNDSDATTLGEVATRIGRDPLFATPNPTRLASNLLPTVANGGTAAAEPIPIALPELDDTISVDIVPFDVTPHGDRWYADVEFATPAGPQSYNPLVQLAVARYQAASLHGLWLSPIVATEPVPLLPARHVVVTRSGNRLIITVEGASPHPPNTFDAILEECDAGIDPRLLDVIADDTSPISALPAWRPIPGHSVSRDASTRKIPPLTLPVTAGRLRLRLRETEGFDDTDGTPPDLMRRNVFIDTIVVPPQWQPK